jgi:hypothetical protein
VSDYLKKNQKEIKNIKMKVSQWNHNFWVILKKFNNINNEKNFVKKKRNGKELKNQCKNPKKNWITH